MAYIKDKNEVHIRGRIGKTPETRQFKGEAFVVSFSVVTSETFYNEETKQWEQTNVMWHNVVVWNDKNAIGLAKGDKVDVVGKLKMKDYTNKEGKEMKQIFIQANELFRIPKEPYSGGGQQGGNAAVDDIPY